MNLKDRIGKRGESIFAVIISEWCNGRPWFSETFLGDKHPTTDFCVELIDPNARSAMFFVQIKSTRSRYLGNGPGKKLDVAVAKKDVLQMKAFGFPAYVVGIDIDSKQGFIKAITPQSTRGFRGIPIANELNCPNLLRLWNEVDTYWTTSVNRMLDSNFS
ncbi:hypothetical protein ACYOEI_23110 [Singulisphaera rosea]